MEMDIDRDAIGKWPNVALPTMAEVERLRAENARLSGKVRRLRRVSARQRDSFLKLETELARLRKAAGEDGGE